MQLTQQRFYDSLLDARIRVQKALLALNSLPQGGLVESYIDSETSAGLKAAQEAAFTLFTNAIELRKVLVPNGADDRNCYRQMFRQRN